MKHLRTLAIALVVFGGAPAVRADETARRAAAKSLAEGNRLLEAGRYDEALAQYDEARRQQPDLPEIEYDRGIALYRMGKLAEAEKAFQDALGPGHGSLEARTKYNLGRTAHAAALERRDDAKTALADAERAISFYNDALQVVPDDPDAKRNLEAAERLRAYLQKRMEEQKNQQEEKKESEDQKQPTSQPDQPPSSQPSSQPTSQPDQQQESKNKQDQQDQDDQEQAQDQDDKNKEKSQPQDSKDAQEDGGKQGETPQPAQEDKGKEDAKKLSPKDVEPLLQEARDAERRRREEKRMRLLRMRGRVPVDKDW